MKVMVATDQSQGVEAGDYCWTLDGELVLSGPSLECDNAGACGCGRGFPGLGSCRATTTAMVVDRPEIDRVMLGEVIRDSLDRQGLLLGIEPDDVDELVEDEVELIERITAAFPVGAVIGRAGTDVWERARRVA
ncbi:MAG: hypothetical protein ABW195_10670 [Ilumatobacteraceae bacterium]